MSTILIVWLTLKSSLIKTVAIILLFSYIQKLLNYLTPFLFPVVYLH